MTPPQPNGPPQHIQIEMARRELKALKQQQAIAEQGIAALSGVAAELSTVDQNAITPVQRAMLAALVALVSIKLLELQTGLENLNVRIPELENALRVADSGIALPGGMRIKN